ncbi:hypothetical protein QN277_009305 [Acacia crassicarpa]|uniref:Uncharacterized protein n=1 Tax=Acacia crassicarpa TaxID=499986 RepID=A0AAE1ITJ0_9FABA|nr:hypothetical protein QN277_009305 [Acacia crassicarpa]
MSRLYHFVMTLLMIASTLLLQCPNTSAGMTMRKLAGPLPRKPPPPIGSPHKGPIKRIIRSPPPSKNI